MYKRQFQQRAVAAVLAGNVMELLKLVAFCVRQADDEENPCKSRTFGLPERENCAEESSHVGAISSNTRFLR